MSPLPEEQAELLRRHTLTLSKLSTVSLLGLIWSQSLLATAAQVWLSARTNTSTLIAPSILQQSSKNDPIHPPSAVRCAVGFWDHCGFILASEPCVGPKGVCVCALGTHKYEVIQGQCLLAQSPTPAPCKPFLQSSIRQHQL